MSSPFPPAGRTPVVFTVFNRPRHTEQALEAIRAYRPSRLFVVADAPRADRPEDAAKCAEVAAIVRTIDWPCETHYDFAPTNMGCARRVTSALNRVFEVVDRAIVLEDDNLATPGFFTFCDAMLDRYESHENIWVVGANSYQPEFQRGDGSYYFSRYPDSWGWATWRRAWRHFQFDLPFLDAWVASDRWRECAPTAAERRYFLHVFRQALRGDIDSWSYRWLACALHADALCITPNANLVKNTGFGAESTHTRSDEYEYPLTSMQALRHPSRIEADEAADAFARAKWGFRRTIPGAASQWLRQHVRRFLRGRAASTARGRAP